MWEEKDAFHIKGHDVNWWWDKARMEIVHECMKKVILRVVNILEIGAGYGGMTSMLTKFGPVKAIEPYPGAASYLRDTLKIETYHGTLESFTETERYDLVTCFDVLEHIADDGQALSKIESLVNDKGFLVLTVPAYRFLWNRHDEINQHYRRYNRKELIRIIPRSFIIRKASYFNTLLFPMAIADKLLFAKNKRSYSLNPNKLINGILYTIFSIEKWILQLTDLPFGVSILLIAEKRNSY